MKNLPVTRNENIVVRNIGEETLIYDLVVNKAYCLNSTLTKVYAACDGKTTFEEFKNYHQFPADLIFLSIDELKRENLIVIDDQYQSPLANLTRREVAKRVGLSTLISLPLISSLVAPQAINAASLPGPPCLTANQSCPFDGTFTQGACCDGLRCLTNGFCLPCRTSNTPFPGFATAPAGCTDSVCNLNPITNWCCSRISFAVITGPNLCECRCQ